MITIMLWIVPQLQNTMKFLQTQVMEYFKQGLSPSGAYNALMNELQEKWGSD